MTRPSERLKNTKRPSAPAKGLQKQSLKLQNIAIENTGLLKQSVKGVAKKLKTQVAGQLTSKPSEKSPSTANHIESGSTIRKLPFVKDTKGSRLALNLLLVRPWFLLAGFWVVSLVSAAVAWEGMISPKILTMDLPQPAAENVPVTDKNSFLSVEEAPEGGNQTTQQNTPQTEPAAERSTTDSAATNTANSTGEFPTWPIGALVGTCAAGCLVMSRRRAMVRMAASRSQGKRRVRPNVASPASHKHSSPLVSNTKTSSKTGRSLKVVAARKPKRSPQRAQPKGQPVTGQPTRIKTAAVQTARQPAVHGMVKQKKRRQRRYPVASQAIPKATTGTSGTPTLASRSSDARSRVKRPQAVPTAQNRSRPRKHPSVRGRKHNQSVVSVVPASESNALDWRNGSLAHQLDVRPQRTASM